MKLVKQSSIQSQCAIWAKLIIWKFVTLNVALDQFSPAWPSLLIFPPGLYDWVSFSARPAGTSDFTSTVAAAAAAAAADMISQVSLIDWFC